MGFALQLIGQLSGVVFESTSAATGGFAADLSDFGERGDEDGFRKAELFEPAGEHATDIAGMSSNAHRSLRSGITMKYQKTAKKRRCEKQTKPKKNGDV
jgi:hypothetical protein